MRDVETIQDELSETYEKQLDLEGEVIALTEANPQIQALCMRREGLQKNRATAKKAVC